MTCNQYHFSPSARAITYAIILHSVALLLFLFTLLNQTERAIEQPDREPTIIIQPSSSGTSQPSSGTPIGGTAVSALLPQPPPMRNNRTTAPQQATPSPLPPEAPPELTDEPEMIPPQSNIMHLDQPPRDPATVSPNTPEALPPSPRDSPRESRFTAPPEPEEQRPHYQPSEATSARARQAIRRARESMYARPKAMSTPDHSAHTYQTFIPPDNDTETYTSTGTRAGGAGQSHTTKETGAGDGTGELSQEQLTHALNHDFVQRAVNEYKSFVMYALCYELNKQNIHASPQDTQHIITTHITVECNGTISNVRVEHNQQNPFTAQVIQGIYAASPIREIPKNVSDKAITFVFTIHPNNTMGAGNSRQPGPIKFFIVDPWQTDQRGK